MLTDPVSGGSDGSSLPVDPPAPTIDLTTSGPFDDEDVFEIGARIDDTYTVLGVLGSGGMGTVYHARDEALGREVAVKLIHDDVLARPNMREAFGDEARTMARVRHENVATIYALGEHRGRPYIVMEYIDGPSLGELIGTRRAPGIDVAVEMLVQLCAGVAAIHAAGALHGDLKPGNVVIASSGRVVITDFGLSRALHAVGGHVARHAFGTPGYLAPEIAREDPLLPRHAPAIDTYALGVIAFELLTGKRPFASRSLPGLLHEHGFAPIPRASATCPELGTAFDSVLARAMAKQPDERTASASVLAGELQAAALGRRRARPISILVVDDEPNALLAIRELLLLAFPGAEVTTVTNTATALAIAARHAPDIVVADYHMPDGGARRLTEALRTDVHTCAVPIVVVTGVAGGREWDELRSMGADRFLVKPVDFDALAAMIRALVPERG